MQLHLQSRAYHLILGFWCVTFTASNVIAQATQAVTNVPISPSNPVATSKTDNLAWQHLSSAQHQALQPLAVIWSKLSETQKKKWVALSANFHTLPAPAQERLHARMTQWATLTPKQRSQARLNYSQTKRLPLETKAERWEVYQSLTPEQKKQLAASAPKVPLAPQVKVPSPAR